MKILSGISRPDREPKPGDPLRDPNKNPAKVNPSPPIHHDPKEDPANHPKPRRNA